MPRLTALKVNSAARARDARRRRRPLFASCSATSRSWIWRYMRQGRSREMGLGSVADVTLQSARETRDFWRRRMRTEGIDPIEARRAEIEQRKTNSRAITFREAAEQYIETHRDSWKNDKHRAQWESTLITYVYPTLGKLAAHRVDEMNVLSVLRPIWSQKPETASRVRGRIECVLDQPEVRKLRHGENPARWRGNLNSALPARRKIRKVRHHAALPFCSIAWLCFRPSAATRRGSPRT